MLGGGNVFARLLGREYDGLPPAVRMYHDPETAHYSGRAFSGGATHLLATLLRRIFGFPSPAASVDVEIWIERDADCERWSRRFGERRFSSAFRTSSGGALLDESFGPFRFGFGLRAEGDRLYWDFRNWRLGPVPLPRALGPRILTYETQSADGAFEFYSHADFPVIGRLVHYHGMVTKQV
jgi:hypothetical protein